MITKKLKIIYMTYICSSHYYCPCCLKVVLFSGGNNRPVFSKAFRIILLNEYAVLSDNILILKIGDKV